MGSASSKIPNNRSSNSGKSSRFRILSSVTRRCALTSRRTSLRVEREYASSPTYQFTQGPDGKRYATGGEVQIDTSVVPGDPAATIAKMQQIRSAALAPAEPSAQDLVVARSAAASEAKARKELMAEQSAKSGGVLSAYMDKRNSVIAGHYQQAVSPASTQSLSLHI